MIQFKVTGMSCAACTARVEKAVAKVEGVSSVTVNLLTNSMSVDGTASSSDIKNAVKKAGYKAELITDISNDNEDLKDKDTPLMKKRLVSSLFFLAILMYFSMGSMMFGWPVPVLFEQNHLAMGILQLVLTMIVMVINHHFFVNGFKGLVHLSPNMDTLVALGSSAAFVYSTVALIMNHAHELYFESAAMILTLITIGKMLEARSKGKTGDAIKSLMNLAPDTACVIRDGKEMTVLSEEVTVGEVFVVRPGESIPVDGIVIDGMSAVNESALTGESIPIDKVIGDEVSAATINQSGVLKCKAVRVGENTSLSRIIDLVKNVSASKAPIAKIADKVSGVFVPIVIVIAIITIVCWLFAGQTVGYALARGISVLVISCPCALGLATPVAIMVGNGVGAKNGILFKTAASLEVTGKVKTIVLDKTGTITKGEPHVTDVFDVDGSDNELLSIAASLEYNSEHPLGKAITAHAKEHDINTYEVYDFEVLPGNGLVAMSDNRKLYGGSLSYISSVVDLKEEYVKKAETYAEEGKTPLLFACDNRFLGIIAVSDVIKPDSRSAIMKLHDMGMDVIMLTGDNARTANAIGREAGVGSVIAGVLPDGKEKVVSDLKKNGRVCMVGDGINDAPALMAADIGIAIGAGTDIARDAADIVLMKNTLSDVYTAIKLSKATLKNIRENLFWAFFYNCIGIPLAAGVFIPIFGLQLNPMFAAAAMSLSSVCVVGNALRLNLFKI